MMATNTFSESVHGVHRELVLAIDVSDLLLVDLHDKGVLTDAQYLQLSAVDRNDRVQRAIELIDILCESEESQFMVICDALVRDGQQRIVDDFLRRAGDGAAAADRRYRVVQSATTEVKQRLQISSSSSSHDEEQRDVAEEQRQVERTQQTAAVIEDETAAGPQPAVLDEQLDDTTAGAQPVNRPELSSAAFDNQVQVPVSSVDLVSDYNEQYAIGGAADDDDVGQEETSEADGSRAAMHEMLPATYEMAFAGNRDELAEKLDVSPGLLVKLLDNEIITHQHRQAIEATTNDYDRVNKLLDILLRRDDRQLPLFCDILTADRQPHIVELFRRNAAVPVNVDMNHPVGPTAEQAVIAHLMRANGIVDHLKRTSPVVHGVLRRLREDLSEYECSVVQDQLSQEFEVGLNQGSVSPGLVHPLAVMFAHNMVHDIRMVLSRHGDSILVYFLCKAVNALYKLGQMIMSGFMRDVFTVFIQTATARTSVDVYMRMDQLKLRHLCLRSPEHKVLRSPPSPLFFKSTVYQRDISPPQQSLPGSVFMRREKSVVYQRGLDHSPLTSSHHVAADAGHSMTSSDETSFTFPPVTVSSVDCLLYELREPILLTACWLTLRSEMKSEMRPYVDIYIKLSSVSDRFYEVVRDRRFRRVIQRSLKVTCSPYRYRIDLVRQLTYTEQCAVVGVTTLNNKIFVLYQKLSFIVVYMSQEPYTRLPNIPINGLKNPSDIAAGSSCSYVSDGGSDGAIWRVKAADSKVDQWLSGVGALSVSVTSEEKLVLMVGVDYQGSVEEEKYTWHGEIHIYSPGAVKETVIKLSRDVSVPHCAIMTSRKTFIVSYGVEWHEMNRVCEVDMTGRTLKAFGSAPGEAVGQLNRPLHASLDNEERIIVADTENHRVLLLNKQLMLQRVLVMWPRPQSLGDVYGPQRLYYDSHSGRLLVGLVSGHVDIYQLCD